MEAMAHFARVDLPIKHADFPKQTGSLPELAAGSEEHSVPNPEEHPIKGQPGIQPWHRHRNDSCHDIHFSPKHTTVA
jgi:hypothetical protein